MAELINPLFRFIGNMLKVGLVFLGMVNMAVADLSISTPASSGATIASCSDYATEVFQDPWDFNNTDDVLRFIPSVEMYQLKDVSMSGGVFSATATSNDPRFYLLAPRLCDAEAVGGRWGHNYPIDTGRYYYLTIRMYTDTPSYLQVVYNYGCDYDKSWVITDRVATKPGWNVYTINMNTVAHLGYATADAAWNAQPATGLRIDPTEVSGAVVKVDYIRLESSENCGSAKVDFQTAANEKGVVALFVDDDTNPFNGYVKQVASVVSGEGAQQSASLGSMEIMPAQYYITGYVSDDYATVNGSDPWDFNSSGDIFLTTGITNGSVSSGAYTGTTSSAESTIYLRVPSGGIDTSKFSKLSIGISRSSGGYLSLFWSGTSGGALLIDPAAYDANGDGVYQIDMSAQPGWSGTVSELILRPAVASGVSFSLDFVSLRSNSYVTSLNTPNIASAPGSLTVNTPPLIQIYQPDKKGGEAFSPRNYASTSEVLQSANLAWAEILPFNLLENRIGDFFYGANQAGNRDPVAYMFHPYDPYPSIIIDADRYKNLTWMITTFLTPSGEGITNGLMQRVIYRHPDGNLLDGDDIVSISNGWSSSNWYEFVVDLTEYKLDGQIPGSWSGSIDGLRIDPHEFLTQQAFAFDYAILRADDEANQRFAIDYDIANLGNNTSVNFYYNSAKSTSGGTLIGTVQGESNTRILPWDTSAVPDGTYYMYAAAYDGYNLSTRLASGRIVINHSRAQDSTAPVLSVQTPADNALFDSQLQIKGYALDALQLAHVEVLLDGSLLSVIRPADFNKDARTNYPGLAESSNAGFNQIVDTSAVGVGKHSLVIKAYDTAANETSYSVTIEKVAGANPTIIADPDPDGVPQSISVTPGATPAPTPKAPQIISKSISKKGVFKSKIGEIGGTSCSISIYIGNNDKSVTSLVKKFSIISKDTSKGVLQVSASKININYAKLKKFYLRALKKCNNQVDTESTIVSLKVPKTKGSISSLAALKKALAKNIKRA